MSQALLDLILRDRFAVEARNQKSGVVAVGPGIVLPHPRFDVGDVEPAQHLRQILDFLNDCLAVFRPVEIATVQRVGDSFFAQHTVSSMLLVFQHKIVEGCLQ